MWRATAWVTGLSVLITALGVANNARGLDPVKAAPDHYKVIFENERVRVLSFHSSPGEKWPLHMHPDAVTVSLTDYKLRNVVPGTVATIVERKRGDAYWIPARSHTGENIGTTDMDSIIVELKEPRR
jgi:beta-alanine degradation protein BauB